MSNELNSAIAVALAELSRAYYAAESADDISAMKATAIAYATLNRTSGHVTPQVNRPATAGWSVPPKH